MIAFVLACPVIPVVNSAQENLGGPELDYTSTWRLTNQGWVDSSDWNRSITQERPIERVSPVLFAANVLLATLFALIWTSNECEFGKLLGNEYCQARTVGNENRPLGASQ